MEIRCSFQQSGKEAGGGIPPPVARTLVSGEMLTCCSLESPPLRSIEGRTPFPFSDVRPSPKEAPGGYSWL